MRDHFLVPEERPSEVLGALPRTRPHRRSDKRAARPPAAMTETREPAAKTPEPAAKTPEPAAKTPEPAAKTPEPAAKAAKASGEAPASASQAAARAKPRLRQPAQPTGAPAKRAAKARPGAAAGRSTGKTKPRPRPEPPAPSREKASGDVLGTAVQAAAELAEIGLAVSARTLRRAIQRLPRP